jgi:hypothetical protein
MLALFRLYLGRPTCISSLFLTLFFSFFLGGILLYHLYIRTHTTHQRKPCGTIYYVDLFYPCIGFLFPAGFFVHPRVFVATFALSRFILRRPKLESESVAG